jgi:hypothetical protein
LWGWKGRERGLSIFFFSALLVRMLRLLVCFVVCLAWACVVGVADAKNETCVKVDPTELDYCAGLVAYAVPKYVNVGIADALALDSYQDDMKVWERKRATCEEQILGKSMCNECLAIKRAWHCANNFPKCTIIDHDESLKRSNNKQRVHGACRGLCEKVVSSCSLTTLECEDYPDFDCASVRGLHTSGLYALGFMLPLIGLLI